jgi:hypothetical protein
MNKQKIYAKKMMKRKLKLQNDANNKMACLFYAHSSMCVCWGGGMCKHECVCLYVCKCIIYPLAYLTAFQNVYMFPAYPIPSHPAPPPPHHPTSN